MSMEKFNSRKEVEEMDFDVEDDDDEVEVVEENGEE